MFKAFFDESGTDPKLNKALVLGGFFGRVEEWERASDAWDTCLHDAPSIEYFKQHEAQSLSGEFRRFNRTSAEAKVLALAKTITRFELQGFCITVGYRLFRHRDPRAAKGRVGTRVYDWGFLTATSGVLQYMDDEQPGDEKVDFVFDERGELPACIEHYNWMKTSLFLAEKMRRAGECAPGNDRDVAALQMGDLLAWEFCNQINTKEKTDVFKHLAESRTIAHIDCAPPRQFANTLALQRISKQVHAEAENFLRRANNKSAPDRFRTAQEVHEYASELSLHESYVQLEFRRYREELRTDEEYQEFEKRYFAATGEEPPM